MDTRAAWHTLPVPVMDIPCLVIPETALQRTGRLGRVRYRACWLSFGLEFTLNALRRLLPARANASVKSIAPVRDGP